MYPETNVLFDGAKLRQLILEAVDEYNKRGPASMQTGSILKAISQRIPEQERRNHELSVLTFFYDLFRTGYLAPGFNFTNPDLPFCHVTARGREVLKHFSRDPANPDGYLAHLDAQGTLDAAARSYIEEAVRTYNSECYRAAAVMVGVAAEYLVLGLRDVVVSALDKAGAPPPPKVRKKLDDWRAKTVHDGITEALTGHLSAMPRPVQEAFASHWPALAGEIRRSRNDAGHPGVIHSVTPEQAHADLLIFPPLAKLTADLVAWVQANIK